METAGLHGVGKWASGGLQGLFRHYYEFGLFAAVSQRLSDPALPITRFVDDLSSRPTWTTDDMNRYFGTAPLRSTGLEAVSVFRLAPEYRQFLEANHLPDIEADRLEPSRVVHDLVGHVLFDKLIDAEGELAACAAVMGFCPATGTDYFICALLMFSFGHQLYDDVKPHRVRIDSDRAGCLDELFRRGEWLRRLAEFTAGEKSTTADFVVEHWSQLRELRLAMHEVP